MQFEIYTCRKGHESSVSSGGQCPICDGVQDDGVWREATRAERASALAESFPTLRDGAHGVRPWSPSRLSKWAASPDRSMGQAHAARFVLEVWDADIEWSCGPFRLGAALRSWDDGHREAFQRWARELYTL